MWRKELSKFEDETLKYSKRYFEETLNERLKEIMRDIKRTKEQLEEYEEEYEDTARELEKVKKLGTEKEERLIDYRELLWHSDWNGYEVGFDDVLVAGLYSIKRFPEISLYIDTENEKVLDVWLDDEEEY